MWAQNGERKEMNRTLKSRRKSPRIMIDYLFLNCQLFLLFHLLANRRYTRTISNAEISISLYFCCFVFHCSLGYSYRRNFQNDRINDRKPITFKRKTLCQQFSSFFVCVWLLLNVLWRVLMLRNLEVSGKKKEEHHPNKWNIRKE